MKRLYVIVKGRVQGVAFRYSAQRKAWQLILSGWVRNLPDGNVEAVFEGGDDALKEMLDWCSHGPEMAQVLAVDSTWKNATGEFTTFDIR